MAVGFIQVTKGKRVCPGFQEEKAKQVRHAHFSLEFLASFHMDFIFKNKYIFMKKQQSSQCLTLLYLG